MATKRNPKQEAKAAAEKALATAAKKKAAADKKAVAAEKKAVAAKRKTANAKEKAVSRVKPPASVRMPEKKDVEVTTSADNKVSRQKASKPAKRGRWLLWVILSLVAMLVIAAAGFSWDRWLRYDDAADFQGEWFIADSTKAVLIDKSAINLTDDVAFLYQIDPVAKTISFSFGNKENVGRYHFSSDRKQLIIVEGSSYTTLSTLFEDIALVWENLVRGVRGEQPVQPEAGNGVTVFQREKAIVPASTADVSPNKTPASDASAAGESSAALSSGESAAGGASSDTAAEEKEKVAEPNKTTDQNTAAEQKPDSSSLPDTLFDNVVDQ
ncbi:MAG: hypothetical protein VB027_05405 [Gordonibacter sp.]|nr:hypothetical protein [Gordonibacter sp.]